jgi:hypothetical protein
MRHAKGDLSVSLYPLASVIMVIIIIIVRVCIISTGTFALSTSTSTLMTTQYLPCQRQKYARFHLRALRSKAATARFLARQTGCLVALG